MKEFITTRSVLWKMLKGIIQAEKKGCLLTTCNYIKVENSLIKANIQSMKSSTKAKQQNNQNDYSYNILLMDTQYQNMQSTTAKTHMGIKCWAFVCGQT